MTYSGVLLTGGASRRMGVDKATIVVNGETLAARAGRVLSSVCAPVIEVGLGVSGLPSCREQPPGGGPLAAFLAGIEHLGARGDVVLLACDLPFVDEETLRWVAEQPGAGSVVPTVDGKPQYACARWSAHAIDAARGSQALAALGDAGDAMFLVADMHAAKLEDVDAPDDLVRLGISSRAP